ncbi:MAG: SusC/RagA family TonB-linked outer membrane protein [Bacteroidales bacterium]
MKKRLSLLILMIFALSCYGYSQERIITGEVTGVEEEGGLPGVTVRVKGTNIATVTNVDGQYEISFPDNAQALVFSFVGYKVQEVFVQPEVSTVDVQMEIDVLQVEEVLVVAYGTAKKSTYTGSASVVSGDKIEKIQTTNVTKALQGLSSGVQVINNSGRPGSGGDILIRGIGSLYASSSPLIVVDGVPFSGTLSSINSNDIESVTVLKDATSAALYGSRAAGGVIMITTKSGSTEAKIDFSSVFSTVSMAVPYPERTNSNQYFELTWESMYNGQLDLGANETDAALYATNNVISELKVNPFDMANPFTADGQINPDASLLYEGNWDSELIKPRLTQEYNLSASGTSQDDKTKYYFSAGFKDDKGVFTVQEFKRFSTRVNLTSDIKEWLQVGTNVSLTHSREPYASGAVWFVRSMPPIYPIWKYDYDNQEYLTDDNGDRIYDYGNDRAEWIGWNPLADAEYNTTLFLYDNISNRSFAEVTIMPGLTLRPSVSVDYSVNWDHSYVNPTYGFLEGRGRTTKNNTRTFAITQNNVLSYERTLFGVNNISLMVGNEAHQRIVNSVTAEREGFPFIGLEELASTATMTGAYSYENNYRLLSYFSRLEYDYDNKYYFSGSIRTDGSSRFHPDTRWGQFWSVGGSWRLSEESFLQSTEWIDNLQLRVSYGSVGNDRISLYAYQGLFATGYNDGTYPGMLVSRLPTPDLKWETNIQFNVGLNFRLFDRLDGSFEYYIRDSKDLLFARPLPISSGFNTIDANIADVQNKGVELELYYLVHKGDNFQWDINLNASHYKNVITSLPQERVGNWIEGVSMYEFFMPEWAGINPENGNNQWWMNIFETDGSGDFVLDDSGDKIVEERVKTEDYSDVGSRDQQDYQGTSIPDLFGGITNNFNYKGFELSVFIYYSIGGKLYDSDYSGMMSNREGFSQHIDMLDRWTPENSDSDLPRLSHNTRNNMASYSTRFLYDNTFVRLRNIRFGYQLLDNTVSGTGISSLSIYAQADNLLTFGSAAKRGTDPEQGFSGTTSSRLPPLKSVSVGIRMGF